MDFIILGFADVFMRSQRDKDSLHCTLVSFPENQLAAGRRYCQAVLLI